MRYKVSNKLQFCKFGGKTNIKISLALSIAFSKQLLRSLGQKGQNFIQANTNKALNRLLSILTFDRWLESNIKYYVEFAKLA